MRYRKPEMTRVARLSGMPARACQTFNLAGENQIVPWAFEGAEQQRPSESSFVLGFI